MLLYLYILAIMSVDLVTRLTFIVSVFSNPNCILSLSLYAQYLAQCQKIEFDSLYAFSGLCVGSMPVNR